MALRRSFTFARDPAAVWAALAEVEQFERWWPWLQEFSLEGGALTAGAVLHGMVAPPVPYRMRVDVELLACEAPSFIDARVHGDLTGEAQLRLRPEGDGTMVEAAWEVEMMQRAMRLADRFGHPLLQWGHDRVVDITVAGFRKRLGPSDS